jgi:hypothetical protein
VSESWLYGAVCRQSVEPFVKVGYMVLCKQITIMWVNVGYMELCVDRELNCG